jgi:hypothetical protein
VRFDHDAEPAPLGTYNHVSPRLGFAWDPMGNQRTVVRGGGGLYHAPVGYHIGYLVNLLNDSGKYINQVFRVATAAIPVWAAGVRAGKLPFTGLNANDLAAAGIPVTPKGPGRVIFDASKDYTNTYSAQANFGITQSLGGDFALDVAYNLYRGLHIQLDHETNFRESGQVQAGIGPIFAAIDPTIAQFNNYSSIGNSIYHGLTTSLTKRYSANTQFQLNYTFSKSIDDVTDYNSAFAAFIPTNLRLERAISTFDVPHNFVASAILQSPFRSGPDRNFASRALADISVSPIISVRSGIPFTLLLGGDYNRDNHPGDRPFHAARNTGRGDAYQSVDVRVTKQFFIDRERGVRVDFVAEATNLFNHTNFEAVNNFVGLDPRFVTNAPAAGVFNVSGDRALPSTSPLGFTSAFDPRRFQFGLKIAF